MTAGAKYDAVICVTGPTASGKTALAATLAREMHGEVVSCDSMQLYRGMDVGTAKPTADEMLGVPHHMIGIAGPTEDFSVGRFTAMADPIVQDILARGKTCILAGGTGLYMDALISGRSFAPCPQTGRREMLETMADEKGMDYMHEYLASFDPDSAARLPVADRRRILRAAEIYLETGETITEHDRKSRLIPPRYRPAWLGLTFSDRAELYRRIDLRVDLMQKAGLRREVEALLENGVPASATAMQAIGYKEMAAAIRGDISEQEALDTIKRESRRYAKRQLTWLRRNDEIFWIDRSENAEFSAAANLARQHLASFAPFQ